MVVSAHSVVQDELALIASLHEGPFESSPWTSFLQAARATFACDYAGIIFRPADRIGQSPVELFSGAAAAPDLHRLYRERFSHLDFVLGSKLQEGRVYRLDELFDERNRDHRAYRRSILIPRGIRFMRSVRVAEPGGVEGWLFIARQTDDFAAEHDAILARTADHFRLSLRTYMALENRQLHARIADEAISRLNFGWVSLDNRGAVIEVNPQARQILRNVRSLRITRNGQLATHHRDIDQRLREAISKLIQNPTAPPLAIGIDDDPWLNALLTPVAPRPAAAGRTPVIIMFLQSDRKSRSDRHDQIAELFGLLPCEARLAVALSQGASIAEAAAMQHITVETARSYSKSIYAKMGARGQVDVVRFILTSVIALA